MPSSSYEDEGAEEEESGFAMDVDFAAAVLMFDDLTNDSNRGRARAGAGAGGRDLKGKGKANVSSKFEHMRNPAGDELKAAVAPYLFGIETEGQERWLPSF
jgi:hypothetical protein